MSKYEVYSDEQLIMLLKKEDHHAFTEIYSRYWKRLLMIAWNHSNQSVQSQDIVHEVFISLWERRASMEIKNLSAFLATSVKFSVFKFYQREHRRTELLKENYEFEEIHDHDAALDASFLKEYINSIVEEMPDRCRLVFTLSRVEGMKNIEIAERMNISEKGVQANLTRALKIIREKLNYYWLFLLILIPLFIPQYNEKFRTSSMFTCDSCLIFNTLSGVENKFLFFMYSM